MPPAGGGAGAARRGPWASLRGTRPPVVRLGDPPGGWQGGCPAARNGDRTFTPGGGPNPPHVAHHPLLPRRRPPRGAVLHGGGGGGHGRVGRHSCRCGGGRERCPGAVSLPPAQTDPAGGVGQMGGGRAGGPTCQSTGRRKLENRCPGNKGSPWWGSVSGVPVQPWYHFRA